jgi:ABC-2 type transport system permease protein
MGWMFSLVVFLEIIFRNTNSVAGWTKPEMFVLFGTYSLLRGISNTLFYNNLSQIPLYVRKGEMDYILTKPVNSQFFVSLRYVSLDDLGQSLAAVFVIGYGWLQLPSLTPSPLALLDFALLLVCGLILFYSLNMLLMTLSFWLVRLDNLMVLADTVFQVARQPVDIFRVFGLVPRFILTYIVPLAFLAGVPVRALFHRDAAIPTLLTAMALAGLFFTFSVLFWNHATRSYSSASS